MSQVKRNVSSARLISKALEIFGPKGEHWISGNLDDGHGNFCMLGALNEAGQCLHATSDSVDAAKVAVASCVPGWKDVKDEYGVIYDDDAMLADVAEDHIPLFNDKGDGHERDLYGQPIHLHLDAHKHFLKVKRVMCRALKKSLGVRKKRGVVHAKGK